MGRKIKAIATFTNWYTISPQTKHPKEAWEFLQFLAEPKNDAIIATLVQGIPSRTDAVKFVEQKKYPFMGVMVKQAAECGRPNRIYPKYQLLNDKLANFIDRAVRGELAPGVAIKMAGDAWRGALADARWE